MYYLLQWIWGLLENIIGLVVFLFFIKRQHYQTGKAIATVLPMNKGNFSLGMFIFIEANCSSHTIAHEVGHTYQNIIFGPLKVFLVSIPSVIRYWLGGGRFMNSVTYYKAWFERQANELGKKYFK